jgi:hypothetical protein
VCHEAKSLGVDPANASRGADRAIEMMSLQDDPQAVIPSPNRKEWCGDLSE